MAQMSHMSISQQQSAVSDLFQISPSCVLMYDVPVHHPSSFLEQLWKEKSLILWEQINDVCKCLSVLRNTCGCVLSLLWKYHSGVFPCGMLLMGRQRVVGACGSGVWDKQDRQTIPSTSGTWTCQAPPCCSWGSGQQDWTACGPPPPPGAVLQTSFPYECFGCWMGLKHCSLSWISNQHQEMLSFEESVDQQCLVYHLI